MSEVLMKHGFRSIQCAHEGCICLDPNVANVKPTREIHLGVFEGLAKVGG